MNQEPRTAIVIGGGMVGCWCAWFLQRSGWQVTVVERDRLGRGASYGNCGYVSPSHVFPLPGPGVIRKTFPMLFRRDAALSIPLRFDPGLLRWLVRFARQCNAPAQSRAALARHALLASSFEIYRDTIAAEAIECQWQKAGLLLVFNSEQDFRDYTRVADRIRDEFKIRLDEYPGEQIRELEPALREGLAGGWYYPDDAQLRPNELIAGLMSRFREAGGRVQEQTTVHELRIEGGKLRGIETDQGTLEADLTVLATGAETPAYAKPLGCEIPIQPGKGFSFLVKPPAQTPRVPMIFEEHHVAVTPYRDAMRVGSTMQLTGYDASLNQRRLELLRRSTNDHLAEPLDEAAWDHWAGWRPMTYDGVPCIDWAPAANNVLVAAGHGMVGIASASATGKLIAELAGGTDPHLDPAPYRLDRFRRRAA